MNARARDLPPISYQFVAAKDASAGQFACCSPAGPLSQEQRATLSWVLEVTALAAAPSRAPGGAAGTDTERQFVRALRIGEEDAFTALVDAYSPAMLHVARAHVATAASAEEVVQETWLALLEGLDRFEERSSIKTWLFRVLLNIAQTHGAREGRTMPFSALAQAGADGEWSTVDPSRFSRGDDPVTAGWWTHPPSRWNELPEEALLTSELLGCVHDAVGMLPDRQRTVLELRDFAGFSSDEVCDLLGISQANQRVLLHRARAKIRQACEDFLDSHSDDVEGETDEVSGTRRARHRVPRRRARGRHRS